MQKTILGALIAVIIVGVGAFYAGMFYGKSRVATGGATPGQFGQGGQLMGRGAGRQGGGFTAGQIVSASNGAITIQMQNGSTQIVLVGTSTQILKSTAGTPSDLTSGTNVVVSGTPNSDGSLTAQSIQIRPAGTGGFGGRGPVQGQ